MKPTAKVPPKTQSGNKLISGTKWNSKDKEKDKEGNGGLLTTIPPEIADEVKKKIDKEKSSLHYDADPTLRI